MNKSLEGFSHRHREGLISAISAGVFLILAGAIFINTPNLFSIIIDFFKDFDIVRVPNLENVWLPAPMHPFSSTNRTVYTAVEQFSYVWGLFQLVILALRFVARSPLNKDAETVSNIVFWVGTGYLIRAFLIETIRLPFLTDPLARWFVFWAAIIMLIGVSLVIRAIVLAAASTRHVT